jgi:tRNA(Ile)-lysidine synthase
LFVQELANKFEIEFICKIQNPKSKLQTSRDNLEQAARRARYNFLTETAQKVGALAVLTAHTLDDQAETVLLRFLRGSGAGGLGAMQTIRSLENKSAIREPRSAVLLIRPLLTWARREMTESYCRDLKIEFRHDSMNEDLSFARVRVRREVLPLLKTFNPNIVETLANTANLLREDSKELDQQATKIFEQSIVDKQELGVLEETTAAIASPVLLVTRCVQFAPSLRRRVLRLWLARHRGDLRKINFKHLLAVESLLLNEKGGRTIELPGGGAVTRKQNQLFFLKS